MAQTEAARNNLNTINTAMKSDGRFHRRVFFNDANKPHALRVRRRIALALKISFRYNRIGRKPNSVRKEIFF
ncbi:hypothetical protein, partial [Listeria booriae]|uniref:hypothetical protein n=1 Tax=Listeria booriae TaxID=1552123 RepID=UPI001C8CAFB7